MAQVINTFPDQRKHSQRVELDNTLYRMVLTWRQRVKGWYMDLYLPDDTPVTLGRRLNARWGPTRSVTDPNMPPGEFVVTGPDDYERTDLGGPLKLIYLTEAEVDALSEDEDDSLTVTLI